MVKCWTTHRWCVTPCYNNIYKLIELLPYCNSSAIRAAYLNQRILIVILWHFIGFNYAYGVIKYCWPENELRWYCSIFVLFSLSSAKSFNLINSSLIKRCIGVLVKHKSAIRFSIKTVLGNELFGNYSTSAEIQAFLDIRKLKAWIKVLFHFIGIFFLVTSYESLELKCTKSSLYIDGISCMGCGGLMFHCYNKRITVCFLLGRAPGVSLVFKRISLDNKGVSLVFKRYSW